MRVRPSIRAGLVLATVSLVLSSCGPPGTPTPTPTDDFHPAGYTLAFADEFDGSRLDRGNWSDGRDRTCWCDG